jgi:hypothetical protein
MRELNFLKIEQNSGPACTPDAAGHCVTCADEARSVLVVSLDPVFGTALVRPQEPEGGDESEIDVSLLEEVAPGDILLVHGGVALSNQTRPADRPADTELL